MKLKNKILLSLSLLITMSAFISCAQSNEPSIYNTWKSSDNSITLSIGKTETIQSMNYGGNQIYLKGTTTVENGTFKCTITHTSTDGKTYTAYNNDMYAPILSGIIPNFSGTLTYKYSIKNQILTLTSPDDPSSSETFTLSSPETGSDK